MKTCNHCKEEKPFESFDKDSNKKDGYNPTCKVCKKEDYLRRKNRNPMHIYFIAKRSECKQKDIPFNLTEQYLADIWTGVCPVFGFNLEVGNGSNSAHLDKLNPALGYVQGNVAWISGRANRIKYDATADELRMIADWLERATTIP